MTKLPRDVSGEMLASKLGALGYQRVRQTGSHLILTTQECGEYHLSVPRHKQLQAGTLSRLLKEAAAHHGLTPEQVIVLLEL